MPFAREFVEVFEDVWKYILGPDKAFNCFAIGFIAEYSLYFPHCGHFPIILVYSDF